MSNNKDKNHVDNARNQLAWAGSMGRLRILQGLGLLTTHEVDLLGQRVHALIPESLRSTLSSEAVLPNRVIPAIEHHIGWTSVPLGLIPNVTVNGVDRFVPIAIEQARIVSGISKAFATMQYPGVYVTHTSSPIHGLVLYTLSAESAIHALSSAEIARIMQSVLDTEVCRTLARHGGALDPILDTSYATQEFDEAYAVVKFIVHPGEYMGANTLIRIGEAIASRLSSHIHYRRVAVIPEDDIVRDYTVHATARWDRKACTNTRTKEWYADGMIHLHDTLSGQLSTVLRKPVLDALMGIGLAAGQDIRTIALSDFSSSMSFSNDDCLQATLTVSTLGVGTIGGATVSDRAVAAMRIMQVQHACDLAALMAACGLASLFANLRATVGGGFMTTRVRSSQTFWDEDEE